MVAFFMPKITFIYLIILYCNEYVFTLLFDYKYKKKGMILIEYTHFYFNNTCGNRILINHGVTNITNHI